MIDCLQHVQNTLARVVLQKPFSAHLTELRRELHWLPIRQHIKYKIAAIIYKAKHSGLPVYLHVLLYDYHPTRTAFINRQQAAASSTHQFVH